MDVARLSNTGYMVMKSEARIEEYSKVSDGLTTCNFGASDGSRKIGSRVRAEVDATKQDKLSLVRIKFEFILVHPGLDLR